LLLVGDFFKQASSRRMLDTAAQFPQARDAWPGASLWGPPLDWLRGLFGDEPERRAPAPTPTRAPPPLPADASVFDKAEQAIDEARATGQAVQREWQRLQKLIDQVSAFFR
jgi:penicillin-binding protein 1A